nr:hypothetical protein [Proteus mirabilis]
MLNLCLWIPSRAINGIVLAPLLFSRRVEKVQINSQPACRNGDRSTCEAKISDTQEKGIVYWRWQCGGTRYYEWA